MSGFFRLLSCTVLVAMPLTQSALADGGHIGKVYDPYVTQLETEIEFRALVQQDNAEELDDNQRYKFGVGRAVTDKLLLEAYWSGQSTHETGFQADAFEAEIKYQLTEQGEYSNDWGLLFEVERETQTNIWEAASTVIVLHEWNRVVGTANVGLVYEWGEGIENEWETRFSGQMKYRYKEIFEPGIEMYLGENSRALGPVVAGTYRLAPRKKLAWDTGVIFAFDNQTPDVSFKVNVEYEF